MGHPDWLESEDRFEAFRMRMAERLRNRRAERAGFLQRAVETLDGLIAEARELRDPESESELAACRGAAAAELECLCRDEPAAAPTLSSPAPRQGSGEKPAGLMGVERATRESQPEDTVAAEAGAEVRLAARAEALEATIGAALVPHGAEPSSPGPAAAAPPAPNDAPAGVATVPAPHAQVSQPWTPRERSTVEQEVERIAALIRDTGFSGETGLLRLKAAACRLRRAFQELEAVGVYVGDVKAARGALQARIREEYGDPYVAPLDTNVTAPDPAQWEELACAYEGLIPALEAFAWFNEHERDLKRTESQDVLEGIGSAQQRLFRLLESVFAAGDDQQKHLYIGLRDSADALSVFLDSLHPSTADAELTRRSARLEKTYRDLRVSIEKRLAQQAALAALHALLEETSFGTRNEDAERLQAAALACLRAGVPKTKPELRNVLLEWEPLLEEGSGLQALRDEIAKEKERQETKGRTSHEEDDERGAKRLPPDVEKLRQQLLPYTRGKRCLFVGGHVLEEHRQRIQKALELEGLEWPETDRFDASAHELAAEVRRSDIVVLLIRFMRTGMSKTSELCKDQGKAVVRLPRGLNVARVVTNFHEQLVPRGAAG